MQDGIPHAGNRENLTPFPCTSLHPAPVSQHLPRAYGAQAGPRQGLNLPLHNPSLLQRTPSCIALPRSQRYNTFLKCAGLRLGPDRGLIIMTRRWRTMRPFSASSCHAGSTQGVCWKPQDSYSLHAYRGMACQRSRSRTVICRQHDMTARHGALPVWHCKCKALTQQGKPVECALPHSPMRTWDTNRECVVDGQAHNRPVMLPKDTACYACTRSIAVDRRLSATRPSPADSAQRKTSTHCRQRVLHWYCCFTVLRHGSSVD
jgi:hypothetical protein